MIAAIVIVGALLIAAQETPEMTHRRQPPFSGFRDHEPSFRVRRLIEHFGTACASRSYSADDSTRSIPFEVLREFRDLDLVEKLEFTAYRNRSEWPVNSRWTDAISHGPHLGIEKAIAQSLTRALSQQDYLASLTGIIEDLSVGLKCLPVLENALEQFEKHGSLNLSQRLDFVSGIKKQAHCSSQE
jgi:hypothetical protein